MIQRGSLLYGCNNILQIFISLAKVNAEQPTKFQRPKIADFTAELAFFRAVLRRHDT